MEVRLSCVTASGAERVFTGFRNFYSEQYSIRMEMMPLLPSAPSCLLVYLMAIPEGVTVKVKYI